MLIQENDAFHFLPLSYGTGVLFETVPTGPSTTVISQSTSSASWHGQALSYRSTTTSLVASYHVAVDGEYRPPTSPLPRRFVKFVQSPCMHVPSFRVLFTRLPVRPAVCITYGGAKLRSLLSLLNRKGRPHY